MVRPIEDYAVIGNCETLALVSRSGSIDWLCMPRFDSEACFCALLGSPDNGRWLIAPLDSDAKVSRRYRGDSLVLETQLETAHGMVCIIDFLSRREGCSDLVRIVRGCSGTVKLQMELIVRFGYGLVVPWVDRKGGGLQFMAGPDRLLLDTPVKLEGKGLTTVGEFQVSEGETIGFTLTHSESFRPHVPAPNPVTTLVEVENRWSAWVSDFKPLGEWSDAVLRSALTLKALAHWETGGIVAAGTTSLPEKLGGVRNWDYRFCWIRDATFTLYALLGSGFVSEARAWREWLVRAVAGTPDAVQTMYGVGGERRLPELELPALTGYANSVPVRIGNAAAEQTQLDVYGELLDALYLARQAGLGPNAASWTLECALVGHLEKIWNEPDNGIWEMRGKKRHFTHSKVMAWVAFDRAVRSANEFGLKGPIERWSNVRDAIHAQVLERGFDPKQSSFVQSYGTTALDASLLLVPLVGFLPASDRRVRGTLAAIERKLIRHGLVIRYDSDEATDGFPPGEGAFIACSFWLVDNYILQERLDEARALFTRLLSFRNDVGLLAEEYDPVTKRQLGNFPQAFSHLSLINCAHSFMSRTGPAHHRSGGSSRTAST